MASVEYWSAGPHAGYRVVWYRDDDDNSGYGDNPRQAFWYVESHTEAIQLSRNANPPRGCSWEPVY